MIVQGNYKCLETRVIATTIKKLEKEFKY